MGDVFADEVADASTSETVARLVSMSVDSTFPEKMAFISYSPVTRE
jgi:hypothetical protein